MLLSDAAQQLPLILEPPASGSSMDRPPRRHLQVSHPEAVRDLRCAALLIGELEAQHRCTERSRLRHKLQA